MRGAVSSTPSRIVGCARQPVLAELRRLAVIEPRIYRAAFVPALLAVVLAMFSFESRPRPLPQGLAADVLFDGAQAADLATRIATEAARPPRRHARRPRDRRAGGGRVRRARLRQRADRHPELQRFTHAGHELVNVIGRRAGSSRRQIVIVAARDAAVVPDAPGSAADTAALMQLARVYQGRPSRKTLVLASVDGSNLGEVGAQRAGRGAPDAGARGRRARDLRPRLARRAAARSSRRGRTTRAAPGIGLQRTVADSIRAGARPLRRAAAARSASSPGSRSRSASARRACCSRRATTRSGSPAAASCRRTATDPSRRSTRTGSARSGARRCARSRAVDQGGRPAARAGELRAGGEPGAARLGDLAARRHAALARARGLGGRLRARAPPARGRAAAGCAGSAPGWRPSSRRSRSPSSSRWSGATPGAASGARAARRAAAGRRRARRARREWPWRWCSPSSLARWLAVEARPGAARARSSPGPAWRSRSRSRPARCCSGS